MLSSIVLLSGAIAAALASPILQARDNTWTLQGFTRTCDDIENNCHYQYTIHDNSNGGNWACDYYYQVPNGGDQSARESGYTDQPCNEGSLIYVNQGYDPSGFIVVVPTNRASNIYAFFGYSNAELVDGQAVSPDHTSSALTVGTFKKRTSVGWSVDNFTRNCNGQHGVCIYSFDVNDGVDALAHCDLDVNGGATQSFYAIPCEGNPNWVISWGYNSEYGFAVMTVVSDSAQEDAWFGYNNVVSTSSFPNQGPNPVSPL